MKRGKVTDGGIMDPLAEFTEMNVETGASPELRHYLDCKPGLSEVVANAVRSLRKEFPHASFSISYTEDDNEPAVVVTVHGQALFGVSFQTYWRVAEDSFVKATSLDAMMVILPGA
jgi:hypothetical protein